MVGSFPLRIIAHPVTLLSTNWRACVNMRTHVTYAFGDGEQKEKVIMYDNQNKTDCAYYVFCALRSCPLFFNSEAISIVHCLRPSVRRSLTHNILSSTSVMEICTEHF